MKDLCLFFLSLSLMLVSGPVNAMGGPEKTYEPAASENRPGLKQVPSQELDKEKENPMLDEDSNRGIYDRIQEMEEVEDAEELKVKPETPTGATGTGKDLSD